MIHALFSLFFPLARFADALLLRMITSFILHDHARTVFGFTVQITFTMEFTLFLLQTYRCGSADLQLFSMYTISSCTNVRSYDRGSFHIVHLTVESI